VEPARREARTARRPGGRTERVNAAIRDAVVHLLLEVGYAGLTMEGVAARAGVHRTTLYRRWPNREELLLDVLLRHTEESIPVPDTGVVDDDLAELVTAVVRNLEGVGLPALRVIVAEAGRSPEVAEAARTLWAHRLGLAARIVRRGAERGQLPADVDADRFVREMIAPVFFRLLVTGETVDVEFARERARRQLAVARGGFA